VKTFYRSFCFLCVVLFLFGCSHDRYEKVRLMSKDDYGAAMVEGNLEKSGVHVFVNDNNGCDRKVDLFIPINIVFNDGSANLNYGVTDILDNMVAFFGFYEEEVVSVGSHGRDGFAPTKQRGLDRGRAGVIIDRLLDYGVDARIVHVSDDEKVPSGYVRVSSRLYNRVK
jgi:hypothetical protein